MAPMDSIKVSQGDRRGGLQNIGGGKNTQSNGKLINDN